MACSCDNWAPTIRSKREHFDERHCLTCDAVQVSKRVSYIDILLPEGSSVPVGVWEDATYDHRVYRAELRVPIGVGEDILKLERYRGRGVEAAFGGAASAPGAVT